MSQLRHSIYDFDTLGATVIAVCPDPAEEVARVVETDHLDYAVLSDPELTSVFAYGIFHENEPKGRRIPRPSTFIIGRDGKVKYAYVGENASDRPDIAAVLEEVRKLA